MSATGRSAGHRRLELDALTTPRSSVLPFLPTLATALVIGSLSLLCRQPSEPLVAPAEMPALVTAEMTQPGPDRLRLPADPREGGAGLSGAVAFANAYPMILEAPSERVAATLAKAPPARMARSVRRACTGARCGAADLPRAVDVTSSVPRKTSPFRIEPPSADDLPAGALPFAPTAEAVVERVRSLGSETASLGGAVFETLSLR